MNNMSNFCIWTKFSNNARIFYLALTLTSGGCFYHNQGIRKLAILANILGLMPMKWSPGCNFYPIKNIVAFLKNSDQKQKFSYMTWCCSSMLRHWNRPMKKNVRKKMNAKHMWADLKSFLRLFVYILGKFLPISKIFAWFQPQYKNLKSDQVLLQLVKNCRHQRQKCERF